MKREITSHKVEGLNERITIQSTDDPGSGGAFHDYCLTVDPSPLEILLTPQLIHFQKGPITESGANGISVEALLAIVVDRLECFQAGAYACEENATALYGVQIALKSLHARTKARIARGVEGTSAK